MHGPARATAFILLEQHLSTPHQDCGSRLKEYKQETIFTLRWEESDVLDLFVCKYYHWTLRVVLLENAVEGEVS